MINKDTISSKFAFLNNYFIKIKMGFMMTLLINGLFNNKWNVNKSSTSTFSVISVEIIDEGHRYPWHIAHFVFGQYFLNENYK